jgi:hypothetical protein
MNQEEIKAKAAALAAHYTAQASGETMQWFSPRSGWIDYDHYGPTLDSDLSLWRIKPEPQRIWISGTAWTGSPVIAAALREVGQEAREFVEVLP